MGGIVGLFDPAGPDVDALRSSAGASSHRGRPIIASAGPVAFGVLQREGEDDRPLERDGSLAVADARIDALLGPPGANLAKGSDPTALLAAILERAGPPGLESVAADFAIARYDPATRELTLARDAFGLRPLFWARRKDRIGFASDPEVLIRLGLVGGDLDREAIVSWLFERGDYDERTPFAGVRRVEPGHAVRFDPRTGVTRRWFRPESIDTDEDLSLETAAGATREALVAAVASRCQGRRVALMLSGGRDSAAVAVALAEAGIEATCITFVLGGEGVPSEEGIARDLATSLGHDHRRVDVEPRLEPERWAELARTNGRPFQGVGAPIQLAVREALEDIGADVVLAGEGGDLLFMAFPVAVFDLLRERRFAESLQAARNFHRLWTRPYWVTAKVGIRAITPRFFVQARERFRRHAPWLLPANLPTVSHVRSDRSYLLDLVSAGATNSAETPERVFSFSGARLAWPLLDQRVVSLALALPVSLRVPVPGPKPVLSAAALEGIDEGLVKAPLGGFVRALVENSLAEFPTTLGRGSLAANLGLVRKEGLAHVGDVRWAWEAADLLGLEIWLREKGRYGF